MYRKTYNPNVEIERLIVAIENLRQELVNKVRQRNGFQDPEVIKLSLIKISPSIIFVFCCSSNAASS